MKDLSQLDQLLARDGPARCLSAFTSTFKSSRQRAMFFLNDRNLSYAVLFVLAEKIRSLGAEPYLNSRSAEALRITEAVEAQKYRPCGRPLFSDRDVNAKTALLWIIDAGKEPRNNSLGNAYHKVVEIAASVLICTFLEKSVLPDIADIIFARKKDNLNVHNLIWAFHKACEPEALRLIAQRLNSSDAGEAELAREILNLSGKNATFEAYSAFLNENAPYLCFTGESPQYSSRPNVCCVDLERKYLQRRGRDRRISPLSPADRNEDACLSAFRSLDRKRQETLSGYSHQKHARDPEGWREFISLPPEEQLLTAQTAAEKGGA